MQSTGERLERIETGLKAEPLGSDKNKRDEKRESWAAQSWNSEEGLVSETKTAWEAEEKTTRVVSKVNNTQPQLGRP